MPAPIDVRAQVFSNLGPVISGQLSDDPVQPGVGLLRTQGEVVISGLIQPARGTELKLGARLPDGKLTRFPRRLRVLKAESDPINNQTTLSVGCLLALKWDLVSPEVYYAAEHPQWTPVQVAAGSTPHVCFLSSVLIVCLNRCGITQATGNPAITWAKALSSIDLSDGYLKIASQILGELGLYGFIDAGEKLRLREVLAPVTKGPFLTINELITVEAIGNPPPPDQITVNYGKSYPPNFEPSPNYSLRSFTTQKTISPAEVYQIEYKPYGQDFTVTEKISFVSTTEVTTNYQTITYYDKDGKRQKQDVISSTISETTSCNAAVNPAEWKSKREGGSAVYPSTPQIKRTETFNTYRTTEDGPVEWKVTTKEYEPYIAFAGSLAIENYNGINFDGGKNGNFLIRETIVEKDENKLADTTTQKTTVYQAWGTTSSGKTLASAIANTIKKLSDPYRVAATYNLIGLMAARVCGGVEVVVSSGRGKVPDLPSELDQQNDKLNGAQNGLNTDGSFNQTNTTDEPVIQFIKLQFDSDGTNSTATYEMQYAPDSYLRPATDPGGNGTGLTYVWVDSRAAGYAYGKAGYTILSGMANGKVITTELRNLPSEPMGTLYLEAAGTVGRFRANGTTFGFDAQGLIVGCDAMLDGGAGLVAGASGANWFPMMVAAANLPTVTPVANSNPGLANTITMPNGFDPMAPGSIWASFGTVGVEGDVYATELARASVVGAEPEAVQRESAARSLTWLLEAPYSVAPVTEQLVSVAKSFGAFSAFVRQELLAGSGAGMVANLRAASTPSALLAGAGAGTIASQSVTATPSALLAGSGSGAITTSGAISLPWTPSSTDLWFQGPTTNAAWADQSGNGRDLAQSDTGKRPVLIESGINGLPVLQFDSTDDQLLLSNAGAVGVTNCSMFAVMKYLSASGADTPVGIGSSPTGIGSYGTLRAFYRANGSNYQGFGAYGDDWESTLDCDIGGDYHIWSVVQSGAAITVARDGVVQTGNLPGAPAIIEDGRAFMGGLAPGFSSNVAVWAWIVIYDAVSTADRQRFEGLLADLAWRQRGVAVPLPSSHPWYAAPP